MDTLNTTEDKTVEKTFGQTISKERLEDIFQAVLDGITVQDTSGRVIYANLSAAKVLGFSSVNDFIDAVNSGIWGSVRMYDEHGNHLDPNLLPGRKVLKGEQSSKLVVKWSYNHHPQEKWSEISASPIFEESGKLLMVVNIFHDITETKLAELEVLRTNRRNRHILESIKDAFVVLDNEGRFLDMNSNAEFVFKKTARELIGKSVWDILPEAKGTEVEQKFHEVILSRLPATFQERYTGNVWFEYDFYPIREGLAVYFRDISQQKNSERYVSELAAIIESSNDAIISKDLDGIITSWNHGAEKLYGYKSHEIVGRSISIIIPENLQNELENILEKIKEGIKIEHYDTVRRKKDGSTIHVSISISPVKDAMGRIIGASVIARDVTHRKVEEQKQALTNKRNQHILDVISTRVPGLITVYNINTGVYTYVNEAVEKILDYSPEEFIKGGVKFVASLVHPDDIGSIMDQNQKLLELANNPKHAKEQDKTVAIFQYRMRHKNGTYRWLQTFGGIFDRDVNGKVDHVMNISVDITQQKETEEKLKVLSNELESKVQERTFELAQNEKRFRSLIENSIDGIALLDENATFKYVSPAITKMLGYESNELVGRNGFELMHLDDKERVFAVFTDLLSKNPGDIAQAEYRYLHKNGSWRWIEAQGNNLLNEEGVKAIVVNYRDITDRKLAEDALRISERRFAMFMQYLPGLAWIKDIEGKYVYVNDSAEQAFGKPRAEIYNRTDDQIFSTETAEQFKNNDIKVIESGIGVQAIETLNQSDGVHHSVVSKFPIFGHNSQVIMVGGVAIDISERLQAEKALNESLERYSSLISATSSVV
ncbi:MAG TPA: PAS domain S-box protein, partial [Verrucomicrobiae bacterium]|nr:PAS domain S-box protein [Verrucomicrobiae bacterium]